MRIAVFDYRVTATNPCGSCHLRMLRDLCGEHEFVVFATEFENPCPGRIEFVRVPAPRRPLALLFVAFHVLAPMCYAWHRLRTRKRFDLVQMVESNLLGGSQDYRKVPLVRGRSVTDACLPWKRTLPLISRLAEAVAARRAG